MVNTMNKKKLGNLFIKIGLLLIIAALCLTAYNVLDGVMAGKKSEQALEQLKSNIEGTDNSLDDMTSDGRPLYEKYPEMDMPLVEIDGEYYVGILEFPSLNITLPVRGEFSYSGLKTAPCRYDGSVYLNNMIIAGHNYSSHFRTLSNLSIGDRVSFTDGDGNLFLYDVEEIVQVDGKDIEGMKTGNWDMTVFTCTLSGQARVTVRLSRVQ